MGESNRGSNRITLVMIGVFAALVGGYLIFSGSALKSLSMPGGFKAEFEPGGMNSAKPAKEVSADDVKQHQRELEQKLRDVEDQPGDQSDAVAPRSSRAAYAAVSGTWTGANSLAYVITQSGNSVTVQEVSPVYGITAFGQGIVDRRHVNVSYTTALDTQGTASLDLSDDGRRLAGIFTDSYSGQSVPAVLQR